jgi:predicted HTH domain antitoxin
VQITVDLPDDIQERENPGREALEALVVAAYRAELISQYQGARLLGMDNRFDFWDFMSANELDFYTEEQLRYDMEAIEKFKAGESVKR